MIKKFLASDGGLKIISVAIAILIWVYIIIVLDPAVEVEVRDIPIEFIGIEQLEQSGISVVNESATTLNIKIKGSRKKMGRHDMDTIIAKVDISGIRSVGQTTQPVDVVIPFENVGISSQSHYAVDIKTEKLTEKKIKLEIQTEGSLAQDYMAGEMSVEPKQVTIKGPESVVGKIAKAGVILNYGGADVDISAELPIQFYDTAGKLLSAQDALLKRISQDIQTAKVRCAVVKLREVKIIPEFGADSLEEEAKLLSGATYTLNPATVLIYGDDKVTAKITSIRTREIPVEKFVDNHKAKAELIIPAGVKVLQDISEVEITLSRSIKADKE